MALELNIDSIDTKSIKEKAEQCYASGGFGCGESVVVTLIRELKLDAPIEMVSLASGFSAGVGGAGCTCGAVAGGIMILGLVFGRYQPNEPGGAIAKELSKELHNAFKDDHRAICCRILTKGLPPGSPERKAQCISFVGDVAEKVCNIIKREKEL
ncbi:MAG: C_GCAxxG_C_C family protein [Dehalococcoidales bacterium]|nr:C_GCAxxG_C_C family protein [Dehalococcoidales bacterium]